MLQYFASTRILCEYKHYSVSVKNLHLNYLYSECLKSKLVRISNTQKQFGFPTVQTSDTLVKCLKYKPMDRFSDTKRCMRSKFIKVSNSDNFGFQTSSDFRQVWISDKFRFQTNSDFRQIQNLIRIYKLIRLDTKRTNCLGLKMHRKLWIDLSLILFRTNCHWLAIAKKLSIENSTRKLKQDTKEFE